MSAHDHRSPASPDRRRARPAWRSPATCSRRSRRRVPAAARGRSASRIAPPSGRGYALTFDDGPHAQGTPAVLEMLARAGVRATFFLVGEQVRRDPALAREIVAAGHGVGLHCDRHRNLLRLDARGRCARTSTARAGDDRRRRPASRRRSTARRTGCSTRARPAARARARLAHAAVEPLGARLGAARHPRRRSPRASPTAPARARCCCCTTPTTTPPPGSWRRTAAALPRVLRHARAARGLAPRPTAAERRGRRGG